MASNLSNWVALLEILRGTPHPRCIWRGENIGKGRTAEMPRRKSPRGVVTSESHHMEGYGAFLGELPFASNTFMKRLISQSTWRVLLRCL